MAKATERLSARAVQSAKPGLHHDGKGLYLSVGPGGSRSWLFRYQDNGRGHWIGLGPYPEIGLARAREKLAAVRRQRAEGMDPLAARKAQATTAALTFGAVADMYVAAHEPTWRSAKHRRQWRQSLDDYILPTIGSLPVGEIGTADVMRMLEPLWHTKPETASRIRGRTESILDYAKARGWRSGENPARWKGHLDHILPARAKVARIVHHPALPWRDLPTFMAQLAKQEGTPARALRFTILTAARSGEVRGATWTEIDLGNATWTIPPARMKSGREHRSPLSDAALAALPARGDGLVFPEVHSTAMVHVLRRMGHRDLTVHGFRSTFRDWCAETGKPADIAEAALAHVVGDATVAAYQRGDMLERRRKLMDEWATFCMSKGTGK